MIPASWLLKGSHEMHCSQQTELTPHSFKEAYFIITFTDVRGEC